VGPTTTPSIPQHGMTYPDRRGATKDTVISSTTNPYPIHTPKCHACLMHMMCSSTHTPRLYHSPYMQHDHAPSAPSPHHEHSHRTPSPPNHAHPALTPVQHKQDSTSHTPPKWCCSCCSSCCFRSTAHNCCCCCCIYCAVVCGSSSSLPLLSL
jgi:hypothetical protein